MCSINNKFHLVEALVDNKPDLHALCITETWITTSKNDLLQLEGYNTASCFCRINREAGGVCIFLREDIDYVELLDIQNLSIEYIFETCAVQLTKCNLVLIVLYWPNSERNPELFFKILAELLKILNTKYKNKNIILGGDLNIDVLKKNKVE
jgi:exonuclease III